MIDKPELQENPRRKVPGKRSKKYKQGRFKPRYFQKYKGNPTQIFYRSGWELSFMMKLDLATNIVAWSSECIAIPYRSPKDDKIHRYFPDFYVKQKNKEGTFEEFIIEIKPKAQTKPPSRNRTKKSLTEQTLTFEINEAKWKQAEAYCLNRGYQFIVMTEDDLGISNKKKK